MWQIYLPLLPWDCGFYTEVLIFLLYNISGGKKKQPTYLYNHLPSKEYFHLFSLKLHLIMQVKILLPFKDGWVFFYQKKREEE